MNCCVRPLAIDGLAGVTAMDCNTGAVTVRTTAGDVMLFKLAVMLLVPGLTPVDSPAVVMVATEAGAAVHVAWLVRFCVLPSL